MESDPPGTAFFLLPGAGADPIWSEPEPPKKVAAPQHCIT